MADTPGHDYRCWFPVDGPKLRTPAGASAAPASMGADDAAGPAGEL